MSSISSTHPTRVSSYFHEAIPTTPHETDLKITSIRDQALRVIRNRMPVTTLFTPELKIDLSVFVKDQVLFHKIAELLVSLENSEIINITSITSCFESSELLTEIKTLFQKDPAPYLALLYEACADVLSGKRSPNSLKPAIEGRIFTLKNALVAQHQPEAIRKSRAQHQLAQQDISLIQEEGFNFIRECLCLHLEHLKSGEHSSFRESLTSTAMQLIPFVQKITQSYLQENGEACPENPLTFRNPTGYNHHGLTAATVMGVCLSALGYTVRTMNRSDLEPRVTLATAHSIVEVKGSDDSKYLVDPAYTQFHKDIGQEGTQLPSFPVLVLESSEIDGYIEKNIMSHWRALSQLVSREDTPTMNRLNRQDQILAYTAHKFGMPKELIPSNLEDWIRGAFKRVWGLSTYSPILSNRGFQDIFFGSGTPKKTYDYIKTMGIASLINYPAQTEVEKALDSLLQDPTLRAQNSLKALSLIAYLPKNTRFKYSPLLDLDPRLHGEKGLDVSLNAYFCSLRKTVNPKNKDLRVLYGCSGADCFSVLLATDAQDLTFVDLTPVSYSEFKQVLDQLRTIDPLSLAILEMQLEKKSMFYQFLSRYSGATSNYTSDGKHSMDDLALKLFISLKGLGVNLDDVSLDLLGDRTSVRINFSWQHHSSKYPRKRSLTYIIADITKPDTYPGLLKDQLNEGFDIFYMKGAFLAPRYYPRFLPHIARSINPSGWLMTADKPFTMEPVNPEKCLQERGLTFTTKKSEEVHILEDLLQPPFDPLAGIPSITRFPSEQRISRTPGSDLTYWAILNTRQKA